MYRAEVIPSNLNRIDRLHLVANEFKQGRLWPPPTQEGNVSLLWDYVSVLHTSRPFVSNSDPIQWRLFLGLIRNIQPQPKKGKLEYDPNQDLESDDEANPDHEGPVTVAMVDSPEERKKMDEERRNKSTPRAVDDEANERIQRARDRREGHKDFFLDDPELSVKIFLSSHFRDKGYV